MRLAWCCAGAVAMSALACAPGLGQSNGVKLGEALAFATAAGAAQIAESVAEQRARNSAPVAHASGLGVSTACDDQSQYACVSVAPGSPPPRPPEPEMTVAEGRGYVLGYVNGVRKLHFLEPLIRDESLDAFAKDGADELSVDHRPGQHLAERAQELHATSAELQGAPEGSAPGPLQDQLAEIMLRTMDEGPGGAHHDLLLRREWRKLGVGIVSRGGRMYLTVDFTN